MDVLIAAAAHALAAGDPLAALNRIALRDDAPGLALRGIAMAQLGDLARAKTLLREAGRAFGSHDVVARARCILAEAEIALVSRDLAWPAKVFPAACATLEAHGDTLNAAHARHLEARRLVLLGRLDEAAQRLDTLAPDSLPPWSRATHELVLAEIAVRRVRTKAARAALLHAGDAARQAGIPALMAEVESASRALDVPAARRIAPGGDTPLLLDEVEALLGSPALIVDACRHAVRQSGAAIALASRPVLFTLARALAEAWPADVPRDTLIARAFRTRHADDTHRARLRVEIGRLRKALAAVAEIRASRHGFALTPRHAREVIVLARPMEEEHADVLAFLADGESWSTSALALVLGASQRTVQRALDALAVAGKAQALGRGRARRWTAAPLPGFATTLLLPPPLPSS